MNIPAALIKQQVVRVASFSIIAAMAFTMLAPLHALASTPALTNQNETVTNAEITRALANTDGILEDAIQTKVSSDSDSAIKAATAGATVDVPKDASDGITLGSTDSSTPSIDISLPNADDANTAKRVAPGTVAYAGDNGSANAVQATEDGGVRMLTIIDNPNAPTAYDYKVTVPSGGHIELTEEGGAIVINSTGEPLAAVASPWAKDANGTPIQTHFTTDGLTLTQHIQHDVAGVVYPVTADPFFIVIGVAAFWWAVRNCVAGGAIGIFFSYVKGERSWRTRGMDAAAGCVTALLPGGWGTLRKMVRILKL